MTVFNRQNRPLETEIRVRQIEQVVRRMMRPLPVTNRPGIILGDNDVNGFRDTDGVYREYWKAGDEVGTKTLRVR